MQRNAMKRIALALAIQPMLLLGASSAQAAANVNIGPAYLASVRGVPSNATFAGFGVTLVDTAIPNPAACADNSSAQISENEHPSFDLMAALILSAAANYRGVTLTIDGNNCSGVYPRIVRVNEAPFWVP